MAVLTKASCSHALNSKAKFADIIQVAAMNEARRAGYCRQHVYPEQLDGMVMAVFSRMPVQEG